MLSAPQASRAAFIDGAAMARSKKPSEVSKTLSSLAMKLARSGPPGRHFDARAALGTARNSAFHIRISSLEELPVRVLVVEDDPLIRELVVETLREEGHDVIHASNGEEALAGATGRSRTSWSQISGCLDRSTAGRSPSGVASTIRHCR